MTAIASIGGGSVLKGLTAGLIGLAIATVGLDPITGMERYTFSNMSLMPGISFVPAIIGTFALAEVLARVGEDIRGARPITDVSTKLPSFREFMAIRVTLLRSSVLGAFIGALPGGGCDHCGVPGLFPGGALVAPSACASAPASPTASPRR